MLTNSTPRRGGCYEEGLTIVASSQSGNLQMTLAGLEPAIFGSEDQRLIH